MAEKMDKMRLPAALSRLRSDDSVHRSEYLGFRLDHEIYAMQIDRIGEILRIPPMTPVPRSSDRIMGVVSVRGKVLTVLDLRIRLGLDRPPPTRHARILVLPWSDNESVGLYVDGVLQVYRLAEEEIELANEGIGSDVGDHVIGIARVDRKLVVVVRLEPFIEL
jgi:purine-binding chemotaxis protein CheW